MKTKVKKQISSNFGEISPSLAVMIVFLLLGVAIGCVFTVNSNREFFSKLIGSDAESFLSIEGFKYSFSKTFFNLIKYPFALFILSFSAFGILAIPAVVFTKGFMLSLSISSFIAAYGKKGILAALSMFGIQTALLIPCILIVAALSFESSSVFASLLKPQKRHISAKKTGIGVSSFVFIFTCLVLFLVALLDAAITPQLISLSLKAIL